jgi:copper(I)-binding protein
MKRNLHRRAVLQAGLALCAGALAPRSYACEFCASTLRIVHPWTRATGPNDNFAVLSMIFDEVTETDRLIGVETPVAEGAEMGGAGARRDVSFVIPEGRTSVFSELGTYLRLLRLRHPLEVGRTYPLNLTFEKGGLVIASFDVDFEHAH